MPRSAWVEIRDDAGELLVSIPARIQGGSVSADLPAFPPNTLGTIQLYTDEGGRTVQDPPELEELPTKPLLMVVQMG
jgi:hypothetical protein